MFRLIAIIFLVTSTHSWANDLNEFMISSDCVDRVKVEHVPEYKKWQVIVHLNEDATRLLHAFTLNIIGKKLSIVTSDQISLGIPPSTVHVEYESSFRLFGYPTEQMAENAAAIIEKSKGECGAIPNT